MTIRQARADEVKTLQILNDEGYVDNSKYDSDLKLDWAQSKTGETYYKVPDSHQATLLFLLL